MKLSHHLSNLLFISATGAGIIGAFTGSFAASNLYKTHSGSLDRNRSISSMQTSDDVKNDCEAYFDDECPETTVEGDNAEQLDVTVKNCKEFPQLQDAHLKEKLPDIDFSARDAFFDIKKRRCRYIYGSFGVYLTSQILLCGSQIGFFMLILFGSGRGQQLSAVFITVAISWILLIQASSMYVVMYGDTHKADRYLYERQLNQILEYEGSAKQAQILQQEAQVTNQLRQWNENEVDQLPDFGAGSIVSWSACFMTFLMLLGSAIIFTNQDRFHSQDEVGELDDDE